MDHVMSILYGQVRRRAEPDAPDGELKQFLISKEETERRAQEPREDAVARVVEKLADLLDGKLEFESEDDVNAWCNELDGEADDVSKKPNFGGPLDQALVQQNAAGAMLGVSNIYGIRQIMLASMMGAGNGQDFKNTLKLAAADLALRLATDASEQLQVKIKDVLEKAMKMSASRRGAPVASAAVQAGEAFVEMSGIIGYLENPTNQIFSPFGVVADITWYLTTRCNLPQLLYLDEQPYPANLEGFDVTKDVKCDYSTEQKTRKVTKQLPYTSGSSASEAIYEITLIAKIRLSTKNSLSVIKEFIQQCKNDRILSIKSDKLPMSVFELKRAFGAGGTYLTFSRELFITSKTLNNLFLPMDTMSTLKARLDRFLKHNPADPDSWYSRTGIPHTLGILLWGPPGTGKTSTIKAISKYTNRHLVQIFLDRIKTPEELRDVFFNEKIQPENSNEILEVPINKKIYVIEDVDATSKVVLARKQGDGGESDAESKTSPMTITLPDDFNDFDDNTQRNIVQKLARGLKNNGDTTTASTFTLSDLLNVFDGVVESPGRIIIMTSNHPEMLDPALVRPGRIDVKIKLGFMDAPSLSKMIDTFCDDGKVGDAVQLEKVTGKLTPARAMAIILGADCDREKSIKQLVQAADSPEDTDFKE